MGAVSVTGDSLIDQLRSDADEMADRHGYTAVPRRMREAADRLDAAREDAFDEVITEVSTVLQQHGVDTGVVALTVSVLEALRDEGGDDDD